MYLHKDKETFKEIIEQVADDTGCAAVVIEKDYYVTMIKIPENVFLVFYDIGVKTINEFAPIPIAP